MDGIFLPVYVSKRYIMVIQMTINNTKSNEQKAIKRIA